MNNSNEINLLWLYPDLLNLHGDRGNIMAFERIAKIMNLDLKVKKVENLTEDFELSNTDIIFLNPGELSTVLNVTKTLLHKKQKLLEYVNSGKYIIAVGTTGALLSKKIFMLNGQEYEGLGIIDMECKQREMVIGDDLYFILDGRKEIIGSQIQMLDFNVDDNNILTKSEYGYANNGQDKEGGRYKNAIFTNALGPVFLKNPWWTEVILNDVVSDREIKTKETTMDDFDFEICSFNSTKKFLMLKVDNKV